LKVDFICVARQADRVSTPPSTAPPFEARPPDPRLAKWLKDYPAALFSEHLYQSIELMERYSIDLAIALLRRLGAIDRLEAWHSADELCQMLSFQPRFHFALGWILERLIETGCIEARPDGTPRRYRLQHMPWEPDLQRLRAVGLEIDSGNAPTLDLLDHAASFYPAVACGEQSGDLSLFGPQGVPLWLNYFHNDNLTYAVNNWIGATLAADRLSDRRALKILEIGAGVGSGSEALLHQFDERGILPRIERYLITEPNAFFRRRAQRELSKLHPGVPLEWSALDLNLPWENQGVDAGTFDLVYAVNVLHVSRDLLFSMNQARSVLKKDGWLILGECLRPFPNQPIYPELMFQILESFTDVQTDPEIRPNPGFLTAEQWRHAFARAGFEHIQVIPNVDEIRKIYRHFFSGAICGQNSSNK
jgi:SAM-dependent methyltransferase